MSKVSDEVLRSISPDGDCRVDVLDAYRMAIELIDLRAKVEAGKWVPEELIEAVCRASGWVNDDYARNLFVRVFDDGNGESLREWAQNVCKIAAAPEAEEPKP